MTANVSQVEIGGIYYDFDENGNGTISPEGLMNRNGSIYYIGADGKLVTETFVDVDGETLYFGADGTQQFRQWIEDGNGFRYVNSDGHLIKDKIRMTGGYYGSLTAKATGLQSKMNSLSTNWTAARRFGTILALKAGFTGTAKDVSTALRTIQ